MSQFVDEILNDLKHNPKSFRDYKGEGVIKDNVIVCSYGMGKFLSLIVVMVNNKIIPTTYMDNYRLEVAPMPIIYKNLPATMHVILLECKASGTIYDKLYGIVIVAETEQQTRKMASNKAWDEGPETWLNKKETKATLLGPYIGRRKKPFVVLMDILNG